MAAPPPGAAGGAEHEAGGGVFREPAEKEACGCRCNPPVRQGLPGLPGGDKETGGAAAGTQVLPVRVPDGLSRMAGGHGRPERDPLRDA
ncbi:hypothetical protein NXX39_18385 [Bacteroides ovatus]|nr:hypothetical protein [Bacteroides ovatus]MCS3099433.1 hypothetical protein [Bacteroides ovatus]